jgi:transcription elongation GreA/GreB family factor
MRDSLLKTAGDASFMAREADGPMQSRYDTTKTEQAWLANALGGMGENVDRILSDWDTAFPSEVSDRAGLGALVFLEDLEYGNKDWFYIMPFAGGMSIEIEGESIRGLSVDSILGESLLGKEKGQKIEYKAHRGDEELQRFRIIDVL